MIKLNCDLGESFGTWKKGRDAEVMPHIDLANIACGFHASDPLTMIQTVQLAMENQVTIGAHPGYPDIIGFGRRHIPMTSDELNAVILYQLGALQTICQSQNTNIGYVKPHGALYNDMMRDLDTFDTICQAVKQSNLTSVIMAQALPDMEAHQSIANKYQLTLWQEAFADRHYQDNGLLVSRTQSNAVISDDEIVCNRIKKYIDDGYIVSETGKPLALKIDSFCVHGDNQSAVNLVKSVRQQLNKLS